MESITEPLAGEKTCKKDENERDQVIESIGEFGLWQFCNIAMMSLALIPATFPILSITFMNGRSDFWCRRPPSHADMSVQEWRELSSPLTRGADGSQIRDQCHVWDSENFRKPLDDQVVKCTDWEHDRSLFSATILQDFDLVCDQAFYENLAQVVFVWGCVFAFVCGFISDSFGRRPALFIQLLIIAISSFVVALSENIHLFLLARFVQALGTTSTFTLVTVYTMEVVGGKWKTIVGVLCLFPWILAWFLLAAIVAFTTDWRHVQLITATLALCTLVVAFLMPESPKWLLSSKKVVQAERVVRRAAAVNRIMLAPDFHLAPMKEEKEDGGKEEKISSLLCNCKMLPKFCIMCNSWICVTFVYYGLTLNSGNLASDIFLSFVLNGLVEVPSYVLTLIVLLKGGRKKPFVVFYILAGLCLMATILVPEGRFENNWPALILALIGRLCIASAFSTVFVYTSELLPTHLRGSGMGICSLTARFGAMSAPYVGSLDRSMGVMVPIAIFGCYAMLTGMLNLMLPETSDHKLPDTLQEAEAARLVLPSCCTKDRKDQKSQHIKC